MTPPAPPLVIRQQPARPVTPEPLVIREAPPQAPAPVGRKLITISGKLLNLNDLVLRLTTTLKLINSYLS